MATSLLGKNDKDFLHSSMRESIFEHKFIAAFLSYCWQQNNFEVEVLRSEIDDSGYDLVISTGNKTSYLQLKVTAEDTDTSEFPIHQKLIHKERSFILLMEYQRNNLDEFVYYLQPINHESWHEGNAIANRPNTRMIKRTFVQGPKRNRQIRQQTIAQIFHTLSV